MVRKLRIKLTVIFSVIVLSSWGCGITKSTTAPSDPLIGPGPIPPASFSVADVIFATNKRRLDLGLNPLVENQKLDSAADYKMRDMFIRQYFGHFAPDGTSGLVQLLNKFEYRYSIAAENLALGDYKNADDVISAWMSSPGHKDNILGPYREIGIGLGYDYFDGKRRTIVVQTFGAPIG